MTVAFVAFHDFVVARLCSCPRSTLKRVNCTRLNEVPQLTETQLTLCLPCIALTNTRSKDSYVYVCSYTNKPELKLKPKLVRIALRAQQTRLGQLVYRHNNPADNLDISLALVVTSLSAPASSTTHMLPCLLLVGIIQNT